jgi:hypothetical protein
MKTISKLKDILFAVVVLILVSGSVYSQNSVSGMVRFIDNNEIVKAGMVKAFNLSGMLMYQTPINSDGTFTFSEVTGETMDLIGLPNIEPEEEDNFLPTFYPSTQELASAVQVTPSGPVTGIDIFVTRIPTGGLTFATAFISGKVTVNGTPSGNAIVFAKLDGVIKGYAVTNESGQYNVEGLTQGDYILVIHRIGSRSANININIAHGGASNINVNLEKNIIKTNSIEEFKLSQNYPNPFNPSTMINYSVSKAGSVNISIYNAAGMLVKELVNGYNESGKYSVTFNGSSLASGVYYYKMVSGSYNETRKMILVK